jgi:hypothetical protein
MKNKFLLIAFFLFSGIIGLSCTSGGGCEVIPTCEPIDYGTRAISDSAKVQLPAMVLSFSMKNSAGFTANYSRASISDGIVTHVAYNNRVINTKSCSNIYCHDTYGLGEYIANYSSPDLPTGISFGVVYLFDDTERPFTEQSLSKAVEVLSVNVGGYNFYLPMNYSLDSLPSNVSFHQNIILGNHTQQNVFEIRNDMQIKDGIVPNKIYFSFDHGFLAYTLTNDELWAIE